MLCDINKIEELAALFFTIQEIALILDINESELRREIKKPNSDIAKAYYKGKLQTQIELRKQTLKFATKGSPQAEAAMIEFLKKQTSSENG